MPADTIQQERWWQAQQKASTTGTTETATLFTYPGWNELIKDLAPKTPEKALEDASNELKTKWDEIIAPHSPLTPEEAAKRAFDFEWATNLAYGALTAAVTAAEAAGFGQLETPAFMLPNAPVVRAALNAATRAREAYFDATFGIGVRYKALAEQQPTIVPPDILVDAYCKGFIDFATFAGQMMYHGYTKERSTIIGSCGYQMPDIGTLIRLARRDVISKQGFVDWGKFHRIPAKTLEAVYNLVEEVPEPYRLADFAAKGLIGDEALGLGFKWHGLSAVWAGKWRDSQYQYPSISTILELLRRKLINNDTAKAWLTRQAVPSVAHDLLISLKQQLLDVNSLARAAVFGVKSFADMSSYAELLGLSRDDFALLTETTYRYPDFATILELFWRGLIDERTARAFLKRLGYKDDVANALFGLRESLPSTSDLITMVVREAFVPEMVTPAPDIFAKYMAMRGFSKEWADRYWTAHWRPIGLEQAYDNVRRGLHDKDWLRNVLKIQDVHPMWWDDIINVMYNPPSIRELGYGWDVGVYTKDDIVKYRMWGGLSPEDAKKSAEAMVAYRTEAERNAVRTELMYAYGQGRIDRSEFELALKELKTPQDAIDYWLRRGDLYKERLAWEPPQTESRSITRADATWAFMHGLRDENWLRQVLKNIGYSDDAVELYVAVAKKKLEEESRPPEEPQPKRLTLSQIENAYWLGLISEDEAIRRIENLGYSAADARIVWKVITYSPSIEAKVKPFTRADVTAFYRYNLWDEEDVFNAFIEMGYDESHAGLLTMLEVLDDMYPKLKMLYEKGYIDDQALLQRFIDLGLSQADAQNVVKRIIFELSIERVKEERALTKSEIIKGVKNGVFSFEDGVQFLKDLGYSDSEARYILVINGIVAAGDPMGYWEMRRAIELMKKAQGKPYVEIPDEVVAQERMIEEQKKKIEDIRARGEKEEVIAAELGALAQMEAAFRKLLKKYLLA
jgi:hypothetical protein